MEQRRVTVFGGSGFLGRYVVERLADRGDVVTVAVRDPEAAKFLKPLGQVGQITPVRCDVKNAEAVATAVTGADAVINLVGVLDQSGRQTFANLHVGAAGAIARAAAEAGVARMVHVSAIGASPTARSEYGRSKAAGEAAVREAFPGATIMRPSVVFGTEDGFFNLFGALARFLPALPLYGGGKTRFQPVYVCDVASAIVRALDDPKTAGHTYELGGPGVYTFAELMRIVLDQTRRKRLLVPVPFVLGDIQAAIMGLLPGAPVTLDQMRSLRTDNVVADDAKTLSEMEIEPTALEVILPTYMYRFRKGGRIGRLAVPDGV